MEIDQLKSATEDDQMEMMMMMMQMDKLPEFYGTYNDIPELPPTAELAVAGTGMGAMPHFVDNHSLINNLQTSLSFRGTATTTAAPVAVGAAAGFLSNSSGCARWRSGGVGHDINQLSSSSSGCESASGYYSSAPSQKKSSSMAAMREMIFRIAAMQPVHIDPESVKPPKRRNVKISKDPQSVAARHRRERISERLRILQRLVPGGTKMDTASMLDEAIHYVKFLKTQVQSLERAAANRPTPSMGFPVPISNNRITNYLPIGKAATDQLPPPHNVGHHFGDALP